MSCTKDIFIFSTGTKLGPYEITRALGAGGMGEVYCAGDTRLNRDVALKVLPEAFASDPERLSRFRREAQVLASLNHPNIGAIYGFEDSGGTHALVMELVEGPTLAERIKRSPIQLEEALPSAQQIAQALEYAHERGIVHRDLKPANIKITNNDAVKILDFGLAKALEGDAGSLDISSSPTISRMATQAGIILGTAAYMSPEQAKGKSVDRRTDIWAFGCVLYEMLSGKMTFSGETVTDTLAAIIKSEPDWTALPANTPQAIRTLLQRCLKKDPRQRLQSIGDARIALEEILSGSAAQTESPTATGAAVPSLETPAPIRTPRWRTALPWAIAAVLAIALIAVIAKFVPSAQPAPIELSLDIPATQKLAIDFGPAVVLSPDASRIAYVARGSSGSNQIYLRDLDKPEATPLQDAQGVSPFFSPDGQWIGFYADDGKLKKVSVLGGAPVALCNALGGRGGSWGADGTIAYTPSYTDSLYRVSSNGGTPQVVTHLDKGRSEVTHRWPQILPGGKGVVFTASPDNNNYEHSYVEATSIETGQTKVLVQNAYFGQYLSSGYLTYVSGGTLFAVPFDKSKLELTGTATPVLPHLQSDIASGTAQVSFSQNGTAVYLTGQPLGTQFTVGLFDRRGVAAPLIQQPGDYSAPRFSPDGKRLVVQVGTSNISVYDIARGTMTSLTFAAGCNAPIWTPDGKMITCSTVHGTRVGFGVSWLPSDGTGRLRLLSRSTLNEFPSSWSPDGRTLAFFGFAPQTGLCCEISILPVTPSGQPGQPTLFSGNSYTANGGSAYPEISPDGHWMAYQSVESNIPQIYVVPFPGPGGKWQASVTGGMFPHWSRTGHELFFLGLGRGAETPQNGSFLSTETPALLAVPYTTQGNSFQPGKPEVLFQGGFELRGPELPYDVAPDGKHFAALVPEEKSPAPISPTVVLNWSTRVARLASPASK